MWLFDKTGKNGVKSPHSTFLYINKTAFVSGNSFFEKRGLRDDFRTLDWVEINENMNVLVIFLKPFYRVRE